MSGKAIPCAYCWGGWKADGVSIHSSTCPNGSGDACMNMQLALTDLYPCPVCDRDGNETDPETGYKRCCRVCHGTRLLDYQPSSSADPFEGIETAA